MICADCGKYFDEERCPGCESHGLLDERYALMDVVGKGASGSTYRAVDVRSNEVVAIKEVLISRIDSLKAVELFDRETTVLARLDHPNVPRFIEAFESGSGRAMGLYLVMEFIEGETLEQLIDRRSFALEDVVTIGRELLAILADLHAETPPIVHRDIKPANVIVCSDGELRIVDFGAVRARGTSGSTVAGTFGYMAPEQFRGEATPESDVYAVAATMVALLTGQDASDFGTPLLDVGAVPRLDSGISAVLERMTSPNSEDRPTAEESIELLSPDALQRGPSSRTLEAISRNRFEEAYSYAWREEFAPVCVFTVTLMCIACLLVLHLAIGMFLLVVVVPLLTVSVYSWRKRRAQYFRVYRHGDRTFGQITSRSSLRGLGAYSYAFDLPGTGGFTGKVPSTSMLLQPGDEVEVAYDSDDPSTHLIVAFGPTRRSRPVLS